MQTSLSSRGYSILKEEVGIEEIEKIKKELTVTPYVPEGFGAPPPTFKVYLESKSKLYLPKSYGLKKFGAPLVDKLENDDIEKTNLTFKGKLRAEQMEPVNKFLEACEDPVRRGGIITVPCGFGKCLAYNTKILMYDGTLKNVQDVVIGDKLMGDDSTPRNVLSLARGRERMYDIVYENGEKYTVNESHILSLKNIENGMTVDICLNDYLHLSASERESLMGYKVAIDFPDRFIENNPYIIGKNIKTCIPYEYKCNSRENRILLLRGIIDKYGGYVIEENNDILREDILYVARSIGYDANYIINNESYNNTIIISGIPHEITLKGINVIEKEIDDYYGFEIDGNRRFILGDFTVTHNTAMAIYLLCHLKVKTLIVVHKEFLLQQWAERLQAFAPNARIGLIKAAKLDIENKDIVIGSLQSLSMKDYSDDVFKGFGFTVIDECHHTSAEVFSRALQKIAFKYTLGLSATPKRKDGLSKVFMWHLGETVYSITKRTDDVEVRMKEYYDSNPIYSKEYFMYNNKINMPKMINNICDFVPRINYIVKIVKDLLAIDRNRKILVLSDRRAHVDTLIDEINKIGIEAGVYYGGMTAKDLKISEDKQVIGGTYGYSSEGLDIPGLNTLILASPKSDVVQVVGRILRDKPEDREYTPVVIDIVDNFSSFLGQARKRLAYYKQCKYSIIDENNIFASKKEKQDIKLEKNKCVIQDL